MTLADALETRRDQPIHIATRDPPARYAYARRLRACDALTWYAVDIHARNGEGEAHCVRSSWAGGVASSGRGASGRRPAFAHTGGDRPRAGKQVVRGGDERVGDIS